jgi:hypothetical protein
MGKVINMKDHKIDFLKKNKRELQIIALMAGCGVLTLGTFYMCKKIFMKGVRVGAIISFEETMKWCNQEFPDIKLKELYENWSALNPEKLIKVKF